MSEINQLKDQLAKLKRNIQVLEQEISRLEKGSNQPRKSKPQKPQNQQTQKSMEDEPGVMGIFDGTYMVTEGGEKFEVPSNYAAKSRLVYGDKLKMIDKDGKQFFKQAEKVMRKRIEGIMNKKEGNWYLLSDSGSYRISDIAAEYNNLKLNDEVAAFIPDNNPNVPFATLDMVLRSGTSAGNETAGQSTNMPVSGKESYVHETAVMPQAKETPQESVIELKDQKSQPVTEDISEKVGPDAKPPANSQPKPDQKAETKPESRPEPKVQSKEVGPKTEPKKEKSSAKPAEGTADNTSNNPRVITDEDLR